MSIELKVAGTDRQLRHRNRGSRNQYQREILMTIYDHYHPLNGSSHPLKSKMVKYIYQYNLKEGTTIAEYKELISPEHLEQKLLGTNTKLYSVIKYIESFGGEVIPEDYDLDDEPDDEEAPPEINFYWDEDENEDPNWELDKHKNCRSIGSKQKDEEEERALEEEFRRNG
ncbi:hypothetical protein BDV41DRAFT_577202 [Aspergillus transmontanensis]|uniref:Uncharacterized protein n=1 Tax=Aspergillus transmontanensis TaxID=1034304 RepID=A0A5N6VXH8_9EURO|nr:hypothetical protein BDV41DRAFT_577202 [Aspergillus transmontanensis]